MQSARKIPRKVLESALEQIKMTNTRDKFIVIIINWSLIGSRFALALYCSFSVLPQVQISFIIRIFPEKNDTLSRFYQYVYTSTVINYLALPIILSFSGARACVELCWYKEARSWSLMGLAVSFNECYKRDTRCNAKINTFQTDSSTHNASDVLLYCTEQFKEAKILLGSSFDYSTKFYLNE